MLQGNAEYENSTETRDNKSTIKRFFPFLIPQLSDMITNINMPPLHSNVTSNVNQLVLQQAALLMKNKVQVAAQDGRFSPDEIVTLTMASIQATQQLFPYLEGTEKRQIATHIIQTVISQLVSEGLLDPALGAALEAVPLGAMIDGLVYLLKKAGNWIQRNWPSFKIWFKAHLCCCFVKGNQKSESMLPSATHLSDSQLRKINDVILPLDVTSIKSNSHALVKK